MKVEALSNKIIPYADKKGRTGAIRYGDLMIEMGEDRVCSVSDCLIEEQEKVAEFNRVADRLTTKISALEPFYDEMDRNRHAFYRQAEERRQDLLRLASGKRLEVLNTYYTLNKTHAKILRELTTHVLAGSQGDHSAHVISLIQRALDMMCRVLRHVPRKSKRAAAVHSIEAARGASKNGLTVITIVPALLHDVLEEELDIWTRQMVNEELNDRASGDCWGMNRRPMPPPLRHQIIQEHIDTYNDHASAIFFRIALTLYDHIRYFPNPPRYYETLHSIMKIVAALSRRRDMSYYSYLRDLLYPKPIAVSDPMERSRLVSRLRSEFPDPEPLLGEYLQHVHTFYRTSLGEFSAKDEVRRNAFRETLVKILDRLNNTRDMDPNLGFNLSSRLYGTGFKNIFFLQAVEDKLGRRSFNTEERRLIEVKFINKPKVAALFQCLSDIEYLEREPSGRTRIELLNKEIDLYRVTRDFRRLTPPDKPGYFNGLIYLFNEVTLGRKSSLTELEDLPDRQAEVLVAFKAVFESFFVYPFLICQEQKLHGFKRIRESRYLPYRIEGMIPGLETKSAARNEQSP